MLPVVYDTPSVEIQYANVSRCAARESGVGATQVLGLAGICIHPHISGVRTASLPGPGNRRCNMDGWTWRNRNGRSDDGPGEEASDETTRPPSVARTGIRD